jgi:hypothetical protein
MLTDDCPPDHTLLESQLCTLRSMWMTLPAVLVEADVVVVVVVLWIWMLDDAPKPIWLLVVVDVAIVLMEIYWSTLEWIDDGRIHHYCHDGLSRPELSAGRVSTPATGRTIA